MTTTEEAGMSEPEVLREKDWGQLKIGDYIRVTCGQGSGRPKLVITGVVDDLGYSDVLLEVMEGKEYDDDNPPPTYDELYVHTLEDDGTVSCWTISMFTMSIKRGKIERLSEFDMTHEQLNVLLAGGHS